MSSKTMPQATLKAASLLLREHIPEITPKKLDELLRPLYGRQLKSISEIARQLDILPDTLYRFVRRTKIMPARKRDRKTSIYNAIEVVSAWYAEH